MLGITLAPVTGEIVADLLGGAPPATDSSRSVARGSHAFATRLHHERVIAIQPDRRAASLADRAYRRLREEIIGVELAPGTLLREDELMRALGVGRTPVREAVQRLQRDGFVTIIPRRGTLVSEINITDLAAIYEVRTRLESWASRLAAERVTEADRAEAQG